MQPDLRAAASAAAALAEAMLDENEARGRCFHKTSRSSSYRRVSFLEYF